METAITVHKGFPQDDVPLYLTLGGAEGRDIHLLAEQGIIHLTEVGGLAELSQRRVVAVESSPMAVATLQRKLPGLKILEIAIGALVRGEGPTTFPTGEHEYCCRARIINLDLNSMLTPKTDNGHITFPVLTWIRKFSQLHAKRPRVNWTLLLTLHGEIKWDAVTAKSVEQFLAENFRREPEFAAKCNGLLGDALYQAIVAGTSDFSTLSRTTQQKVLMAFVPKKLAQITQSDGWRVDTRRNIYYGEEGEAPMVTWVLDFITDGRIASVPEQVYRESLRTVLSGVAFISAQGALTEIDLS